MDDLDGLKTTVTNGMAKENIPCFLCTCILFCQNKNAEPYKNHLVENHNVLTNLKVVISWTLLDTNIDKELKEALSLIDTTEMTSQSIAGKEEIEDVKYSFDYKEENENSFDDANDFDVDVVNNIKDDDLEQNCLPDEKLDEVKTFYCEECDYKVPSKYKLNRHINSRHTDIKCDHCEYVAIKKRDLTVHIKAEHPDITFQCPQCDFKAKEETELKNHILKFHPKPKDENVGKQYLCEHCAFTAATLKSVLRHNRTVHLKIRLQCDQCSFSAVENSTLKRHINTVHLLKQVEEYFCEHCGFKTNFRKCLKRHIDSIHKKITWPCDQCTSVYSHQSTLNVHINSAHKGKRFLCDTCDFTTSCKHSLYKHINRFHKKLRYSCDLCDHQAKDKRLLREHMFYIHKQESGHKCELCSFKTARKYRLTNHLKNVHKFSDIV